MQYSDKNDSAEKNFTKQYSDLSLSILSLSFYSI